MGSIHTHQSIRIQHRWFIGAETEFKPNRRFTDAELMEFCAENSELRVEMDKNGKLIIMPPVDYDGGIAESDAHGLLYNWWLQYQKGRTFSPTTGFKLPDGSIRSADGAWVSDEKIAAITPSQRKKFAPLVPDFVMEVRSSSDRIGKLKKKMTDTWLANGVRLAWLIDPKMKKAYTYHPGQPVEELSGFDRTLSGEDVCPGFEFDLRKLT
ncbi:MAG: Uma2 family endonuclease [Saprospiraceae bacterium]